MSDARFHGVFPYVVSPVHESGEVNAEVLARLCDDLVKAGVHGLTPLGSSGEFASLSLPQRRRGGEGVVSYFKAIAEAVSAPVVLYTNPNFQRSDLSLPVIDRLSRIPNIRYIKDASFNTGRLLSIISRVEGRMQVFAASSHIPTCVMLIGGVGWMAGPACVAPRQSVELYELCRRGDWATAMERQRPLWNLNQAFAKYNLAACIKGGLQLQGYPVGAPLPPQAPLPPDGVEEVRRALVAI